MKFSDLIKTQLYETLHSIYKTGTLILIAGDSAQELFLTNSIRNLFIVTNANRIELATYFENLEFIKDPLADAKTYYEEICIYFSIYRPANLPLKAWLKEDIKKRIFKSDALYFDFVTRQFIDFFGSIEDIKLNSLNLLEESADFLQSEPVLALKSITTASKRNIYPDSKFINTLRKIQFSIHHSSITAETARDELSNILLVNNPYIGISILSETGFLGQIIPEVEKLKKVPHEKDFHPEGNAYEHTIECFKYLEKPSLELSLAVLLHDVGKAIALKSRTTKFKFPNHASIGAGIAKKILLRLKFPTEIINKVENIIRFHMMPPVLPDLPLQKSKPILDSDYFQDLVKLYWADLSSSYSPPEPYLKLKSFYENYLKQKTLFEQYGVIKKK